MIQHTLNQVDGGNQSHKMYIDHVAVNQPMQDVLFKKTVRGTGAGIQSGADIVRVGGISTEIGEKPMSRALLCLLAGLISMGAMAGEPTNEKGLTVGQIIEKNIAARGGLNAWRKIQTMVWTGHIESAHKPAQSMPFVMEMKRPNKTRSVIQEENQVLVRTYDGAHGWKLRPGRNGAPEWQPYNAEEMISAGEGQGIGGPLMDFRARGIAVALDGLDEVEGHKAYHLSVKPPSGNRHHIWIDAETFLDVKYDRESHNALGQSGTVSVYYRNYRVVDGLQIPHLIESGTMESGVVVSSAMESIPGARKTATSKAPTFMTPATKANDRMVIDRIDLNPPLDNMVAKPAMLGRGNRVVVDIESPPVDRPMPSVVPKLRRPRMPVAGVFQPSEAALQPGAAAESGVSPIPVANPEPSIALAPKAAR